MLISCQLKEVILPQIKEFNTMENQKGIQEGLEIATLAGGCFWCTVFLGAYCYFI
jgi:hypothetical protein